MALAADVIHRHRAAQQGRKLEGTRTATVEQARTQQRNAAIGQPAPRAFLGHPTLGKHEVPVRMMVGVIHQYQMGQPGQRLLQGRKIIVGPDIAIDDRKRGIPQQWQCMMDAATGFQRLALGRVADAYTESITVAR